MVTSMLSKKANKRRLYVISRDFLPLSNGTIITLNHLIVELSKHYNVVVITRRLNYFDKPCEINEFKILRISSVYDAIKWKKEALINWIYRRQSPKLSKISIFLIRMFFYPFNLLKCNSLSRWA